ncbi:ABC transporter permease [Alkalinema sp. FACHB-956]|uniref:ABC transporter permease n=1 Tax=Alkalinema sp. FACHB-956 TaxID=2692768 RepID=UPI001683108C|nr:ABC transporter permease [Alkalinema sp. FACHB-956]
MLKPAYLFRQVTRRLPLSSGLWVKADLLKVLVQRELVARYKGSLLGNFWTLISQLTQLLIYTYVFSIVLKVKLSHQADIHGAFQGSNLGFALWLFAGLISWNAFVSGLIPATTSVVNQPNLVKKVVFPLTLLPLVPTVAAFVDSSIGLVVLIAVLGIFTHTVHATLLLLPFIWMPQLMLTAGLAYLTAGLTVFVRDIPQSIGILLNFAFYLTPIMYPIDLIPQAFQTWIRWNPFSVIAEIYRDLVLWGQVQHSGEWIYLWIVAVVIFGLGSWVYRRLTPAFADVL